MSTSRTLRWFNAEVISSTLTGEVRFGKTPAEGEAPTVGHVGELTYTVEAVIHHPDDPIKKLVFTGQPSWRPFAGIHFTTAPVGSPCQLRVDLTQSPARVELFDLKETALFDPCSEPVIPSGPGIVDITPAPPVRPGPIDEEAP